MSDFIHKETDLIVCPYCGHEHEESDEYGKTPMMSEDIGIIECEDCKKPFYADRFVETTYDTEKPEFGTCSECGKKNTPVENVIIFYGEGKQESVGVLCCKDKVYERLIQNNTKKEKAL